MLRPFAPFLTMLAVTCVSLHAQQAPAAPGLVTDQGRAVFRSNCAFCHGADGKGGRGPTLSNGRIAATGDDRLRQVILNGVPGTGMPAFSNLEKDELDPLVAYIHRLAAGTTKLMATSGDSVAGKAVYAKNACAGCHRIGLTGSVYGPDLTRVGSGRSAEYLRESVVAPSADIATEFEGVVVTTRDGRKITGVRANEDTFTLQVRLPGGNFVSFDKTAAASVVYSKDSLMPAYKLTPKDLDNLIAYLETLRSDAVSGADATQAKGIK